MTLHYHLTLELLLMTLKSPYKWIIYHPGLSNGLYNDLTQHSQVALAHRSTVLGHNDFIAQLETFIRAGNGENEHVSYPVLLHGGTGSGKTALVTVLTANVFSLEKWKVSDVNQ